jgi:FMN-dependent NADH-azoreductase
MVSGEINERDKHGSCTSREKPERKGRKMKKILLVESSPRGSDSYSHQAAGSIVNELQKHDPRAKVLVRDLGQNPPPHVGQAFITGIYATPEQRTPEQAKAIELSDTFIDELFAADTIVVAVPMHNFGLPSTLKAWIDHISRRERTFTFSSNGPEGLVKGKRAILVLASGGVYSNGPMKAFDFAEPYLRAALGFIGITDVEVVRVEGVAMSAVGPEKALASAREQSKRALTQLA